MYSRGVRGCHRDTPDRHVQQKGCHVTHLLSRIVLDLICRGWISPYPFLLLMIDSLTSFLKTVVYLKGNRYIWCPYCELLVKPTHIETCVENPDNISQLRTQTPITAVTECKQAHLRKGCNGAVYECNRPDCEICLSHGKCSWCMDISHFNSFSWCMDISHIHFADVWTFRTFILLMYGHFAHLDFIIDYDDARHPIYMCPHCGDDCLLPHIATCKYNPDTFKPASPRSAV